MQKILIVQHDPNDPPGVISQLLNNQGIAYDIINATTASLPEPRDYTSIIALGGSQHVYEIDTNPYFVAELQFIQQVLAENIPYLGICLGGQLLAAAIGGSVKRHLLTELGFYRVDITEAGRKDPLFSGLPDQQQVFHWHEDTFDLPQDAILLATSQETPNQAFRYGRQAYGLQYHIELDQTKLDSWIHDPEFRESVEQILGITSYHAFAQECARQFPLYQAHTHTMLTNFLEISGWQIRKV